MAITGGIMAAGSLGASVFGARSSAKAAKKANKRALRYEAAWRKERQEMLRPYMEAGRQALGDQAAYLGLSGPEDQQAQIDQVQSSPMFQSMLQQGEASLLQNAAATGGLRGGNTQAALAQFSPQLLNQQLQQRFDNLGRLTNLGFNSTNVASSDSGATTQLLRDQGQIGAARSMGMAQGVSNAIGQFGQMAMLGKMFGGGPSTLGTTQNTYGVLQAQQAPAPGFGINPASFGVYGPR